MHHNGLKKKPIVSIIIPAYNEEKLLLACLNSLKKQDTTVPYEIIVVNNNSSDKTRWIAKKAHVRVVDEMKKGAPAARNAGAAVAQGSLFVFIDADCRAPRQYIQSITHTFLQNSYLDVLGGPYIFSDGGPIILWLTNKVNYVSILFSLYKFFSGCQFFMSGNVAIKKSVFRAIKGFNEQITDVINVEDFELAYRLYRKGYYVQFEQDIAVESSSRRYSYDLGRIVFMRNFTILSYIIKAMLPMKPLFK